MSDAAAPVPPPAKKPLDLKAVLSKAAARAGQGGNESYFVPAKIYEFYFPIFQSYV